MLQNIVDSSVRLRVLVVALAAVACTPIFYLRCIPLQRRTQRFKKPTWRWLNPSLLALDHFRFPV